MRYAPNSAPNSPRNTSEAWSHDNSPGVSYTEKVFERQVRRVMEDLLNAW